MYLFSKYLVSTAKPRTQKHKMGEFLKLLLFLKPAESRHIRLQKSQENPWKS